MNKQSNERVKEERRADLIKNDTLQKIILDQINMLAFSSPGLNSRIKRTFAKP